MSCVLYYEVHWLDYILIKRTLLGKNSLEYIDRGVHIQFDTI
jgi:hypothetical protein